MCSFTNDQLFSSLFACLFCLCFKPKQKLKMVAHTCSSLDLCSSAQDGGERNMRPMYGIPVH